MNMVLDELAAKRQKLVAESSIHTTEINDLPDNLLTEILCRLPHHKYVFQCKCISKHWLSLISNPDFVGSYITHRLSSKQPWAFMYFKFLGKSFRLFEKDEKPTPKLISEFSEFNSPKFSLEFLPCYQGDHDHDHEPITIVKTFNDLMLCCAEKFDQSECVYYICNPQTKQWVALPPTPPLSHNHRCSEVEFICEPYYYNEIDQQQHQRQGMEILNGQIKFKVLRFLPNLELQIFSSEFGRWNLTRILLPPKIRIPIFGITRSLFCGEKLILIARSSSSDNYRLSFITVDNHFHHCLQRVEFPGNRYCRYPFRSTIHVSSWQGHLLVTQIFINFMFDDHPSHGVPFLRIWELKDIDKDVIQFKLRHRVSFRSIVSGDPWISKYYLKERSFITRENEQLQFFLPIVLGFHSYNKSLLYLNLNCDDRMAVYNIKKNTLTCVTKTWWRSNFPLYPVSKKFKRFSDVSQLVLPLWPTPVPQISPVGWLFLEEANELFRIVFGHKVSKDILAQWSNQGIRFSSDPETSISLVQHKAVPCGVLAAVQAYVLKYIFFYPEVWKDSSNNFSSITEDVKIRALVRCMAEILFICGNYERVVIASLSILGNGIQQPEGIPMDETISKALEGISIESALDLQKIITFETYTYSAIAIDCIYKRLQAMIPIFQSGIGALFFLISALLSRGLDNVQKIRNDPNTPLVSQEIVNLLLYCTPLSNMFDVRKDLGEGVMPVGIGFLSRKESQGSSKVGQSLKCPTWPIWVVGGESHYTLLFALETSVQNETGLMKERESQIRKAFDAQDQSVEGFHEFLRETNIKLPTEKVGQLCSTGSIVWSELWRVVLDSSGKSTKDFDVYHFNGFAKSDLNNDSQVICGGETQLQRPPRLTKLRVSVPQGRHLKEFITDMCSFFYF